MEEVIEGGDQDVSVRARAKAKAILLLKQKQQAAQTPPTPPFSEAPPQAPPSVSGPTSEQQSFERDFKTTGTVSTAPRGEPSVGVSAQPPEPSSTAYALPAENDPIVAQRQKLLDTAPPGLLAQDPKWQGELVDIARFGQVDTQPVFRQFSQVGTVLSDTDPRMQKIMADYAAYGPGKVYSAPEIQARKAAGAWTAKDQARFEQGAIDHQRRVLEGRMLMVSKALDSGQLSNDDVAGDVADIQHGFDYLDHAQTELALRDKDSFSDRLRKAQQARTDAGHGLDATDAQVIAGLVGGTERTVVKPLLMAWNYLTKVDGQYTTADAMIDAIDEASKDLDALVPTKSKEPVTKEGMNGGLKMVNPGNIIPQLAGASANMAPFLAVGGVGGSAGMALGLGERFGSTAALFGTTYADSYDRFVKDAIEAGSTQSVAEEYAPFAATIEATLMSVNPAATGRSLFGTSVRNPMLESIKDGLTPRTAMRKALDGAMKAGVGGLEMSGLVLATDASKNVVNRAVNEVSGSDLPEKASGEDIANSVMQAFLMGAVFNVGHQIVAPNVKGDAMHMAIMNPEATAAMFSKAAERGDIKPEQAAELAEKFNRMQLIYHGNDLLKEDPETAYKVASRLYEKQENERSLKEAPPDKTILEAKGDPRVARNEEIDKENLKDLGLKLPGETSKPSLGNPTGIVYEATSPQSWRTEDPIDLDQAELDLDLTEARIKKGIYRKGDFGRTEFGMRLSPSAVSDVESALETNPEGAIAEIRDAIDKKRSSAVNEQVQEAPTGAAPAGPETAAQVPQAQVPAFKRPSPAPVETITPLEEVGVEDAAGNTYQAQQYAIPGFEEYELAVVKDPANEDGSRSKGYKVIEQNSKAWINVTTHPTASLALLDARERMVRAGKPKLDQVISETIRNFAPDGEEEPDLVKKTVATKRAYEGDFRQEVKDEIDEALKRLRFHGGGKVFVATPFTVAWDAAIGAIRLARKGGLKLIDAVERGVVFFQNSDWFKSLSADKRDEATRDFRVRVYVEPLKSKLKPGQVKAAIAKAAKAQTKPLQRSFGRYMEKVLERADYADKLDHAEDVRSSIKSKLKSASANEKYSVEQSNLFKQLLTIDPDNVDDLDQYVNVAERALKSLQSLKVGKHGIENQSFEITNEELSGYLAGEIAAQRTKAKEALLEDYKQMVDDGMLSGDLTLEEMRSIINASEDDGGLDDALRNAKAEDKLAALRDFAMLKIADAKSAQKKGLLGDVSKAKSKALDNILSIDPQKLNASDIVRLNTTLNNILTNGDFGGANRIAVIGQEQANAKGLKDFFGKRGVRRQEASKAIDSWRTEAARMDAMTLDDEAAAESRRLMGSDAYGDAAYRVHKEAEHALHDAEQKWKSLGLKPKDDTFLNRARMAVYAFAIQHYGGAMDEQLRAFNTHKEMMRQSVERLTDPNASPENRKRGAIAKRAYDELIDKAKTPDDVRRSIDKVDHRLKKFVDWGVERGSAEQDRTFENVLLNENKIPEKVYNWTFMPQRLYRGASREQLESIAQRQFSYSGIDKSGSGSTTERVKSLGSDRVLDFDFTQNLLQGWQQNNYANETQETRMLMARMLLNEDVRNLLGERNIDILHRAALDKVNRDSWNTKPMSPVERKALGAAMRLMRIGSGIALKSVTQLLKQPIVLMNTMGVLGKDVGLLFKNAPNVMEAQVGRTVEGRGEYMAGVAPTGRTISPRDVGATDSDTIWRNAERKLTAMSDAADKLYRPLTGADVFSAKVAWKAFYLQNLKRRGLLDDYESRPADEQAASYANHMVERMQGSNSVTTMARVYQNDGLSGLFKYLYMPFTAFSAQTRSRMVNDINKIRLGTPEQKKQGARSLASTIGEQVSYNAMKVGLYAVTIAAARSAIRALLGGDDDKEKDDRLDERFVQGLAEDMLSPGWPGMLRSAAEELINETATTAGAEKPPIYIYNPEQYGQRDLSQYGAAAAAVKTAQRLYETSDYWDGVIDQNTKGGISPYGPAEVKRRTEQGLPTGVADSKGPKREETLPVTPQEKAAALIISAVDLMALAGFSDTQINTGINELRKELEKHIGERAGTRVYKDYMYKGNTQRGDGR